MWGGQTCAQTCARACALCQYALRLAGSPVHMLSGWQALRLAGTRADRCAGWQVLRLAGAQAGSRSIRGTGASHTAPRSNGSFLPFSGTHRGQDISPLHGSKKSDTPLFSKQGIPEEPLFNILALALTARIHAAARQRQKRTLCRPPPIIRALTGESSCIYSFLARQAL